MDVLLNIALEALDLAIEKSGNKVLIHAYNLIREEKKCLSKAKQIQKRN
mgnify:CR=1 FL=1